MQKTITIMLAGLLLSPAFVSGKSGERNSSDLILNAKQTQVASPQSEIARVRNGHLLFIENKGQVQDQFGNPRSDIRYHLKGRGIDVYLGKNTLHYQFTKLIHDPLADLEPGALPDEDLPSTFASYRMDVTLENANPQATVRAADQQAYFERYILGDGPAGSVKAHSYQKVIVENVYPNIDWVIYSNGRKVEYDFIVKPGGNIADIKVRYNGAINLTLNDDGSLTAETPLGSVTEKAPYSFELGSNKTVTSSFIVSNNTVSFNAGKYEGTLVIDPVLSWASYIGGTGTDYLGTSNSGCSDIIAVDAECNMYVSGRTDSRNLATKGAYQDTFTSASQQFLAKFAPDGSIVYVTYYPISMYYPQAATDNAGNVYIAGPTLSAGTAAGATTADAYQRFNGGDYDAFLAKFNSDGDREWATFFGGNMRDQGFTVRCDKDNNVYIGGITQYPNSQNGGSRGLATPNAYKTDTIGMHDGFLAKFSTTGALRWATYFGGVNSESIGSLVCDSKGNVYVAGNTSSPGIATIGTLTLSGGSDAFLAKFNGDGKHQWTRYVGGPDGESNLRCIDVDGNDDILLVTNTSSTTGIATPGTWKDTYYNVGGITTSAALIKIDSNGQTKWGTYLYNGPMASVKVDPHNDIWVCSFPQYRIGMDTIMTTPDAHLSASTLYNRDGWIGKLSSDGKNLLYGSFWGGSGEEWLLSMAVDKSGGVYFAGYTPGTLGLATPGAYQDTLGGGIDGIIVRFTDCSVLRGTTVSAAGPVSFCQGESVMLNVETPAELGCVSYQWQLNGTNIAGSNTPSYQARVSGDYSVIITNASGECRDTSVNAIAVTVHDLPEPTVYRNGDELSTDNYASYQWYRNNSRIDGATDRTYTATRDGNYKVVVVDENGCEGASSGQDVIGTNVPYIGSEDVHIYPNPAEHTVFVDAPVQVNITVTGIDGRILANQQNATSVNISSLPNGIYIIRVADADNNLLLVEKLVKGNK